MDDYQFWASMGGTALQIFIGGVALYYNRRAVQLAMGGKRRKANLKMVYWPWFAMMAVGVALAWTPYFAKPSEAPKYMVAWGSDPQNRENAGLVKADGRALRSKRKHYHLAAICFHFLAPLDAGDVPNLSKSSLYDIRDQDVEIIIPFNDAFKAEWHQRHVNGANYALLLVPDNVKMSQFETVHEAESLGVQVLGTGSGPP